MRHRRRGRKLGRNPNHQRALLRSLACALILTERDAEGEANAPKVKGRIVTTLPKAKEVRPLVEKCITIARRTIEQRRAADDLKIDAAPHTEKWRDWQNSPQWQEWNRAAAPVVAARRRALQLLGNKQAVQILFNQLAERFEDRNGGYTRILHLAAPRLGDASPRAIIEFVGVRDRSRKKAERPTIVSDEGASQQSQSAPASESPSA